MPGNGGNENANDLKGIPGFIIVGRYASLMHGSICQTARSKQQLSQYANSICMASL